MSKKIILLVSMLAISGLLIGCNSDSNVESSTSETTIAASSEVASSTHEKAVYVRVCDRGSSRQGVRPYL